MNHGFLSEERSNVLFGADGDDSLQGNIYNDILIGGEGLDTITGGAGSDQIWGDGYSSIVWDARYSLTSNSKLGRTVGDADTIDAGEGNDIVDGGAGNDVSTPVKEIMRYTAVSVMMPSLQAQELIPSGGRVR